MKKKIFAVALAAVMTISSVVTAFAAETLTGTEWWKGMQVGQNYEMKGDGAWKMTIAPDAANTDSQFNVEIFDEANKGYITTGGSLQDGWTAEGFKGEGDVFEVVKKTDGHVIEAGKTYTATITRAGNVFTVDFADEDGTVYCTEKATIASVTPSETVVVHFMAQVGTFVVDCAPVSAEAPTEAPKEDGTKAPAAEGATKAPAADTTTKAPAADAPATGDATATAAMVVVAFAAAAAVVVLKKKAVNE